MRKISRALAAVVLVMAAVVALPAVRAAATPRAAFQGGGRKATPKLLEEAVARGEIDQATADAHLTEVFAGRGSSGKVPSRFQSDEPWDGTLPLFHLQQRLATQPTSFTRTLAMGGLATATSCSDSTAALPNETTTTHFYVSYGSIGGGLTVSSYLNSLETVWSKEVTSFGWAAPPARLSPPPPPIGTKYPVRIAPLQGGLYGFVSTLGTGAGFVGNNPNTPWNEADALASCMVLNNNYTGFPGTPQTALDATTAHEFNHSIQFGYGAASGPNVPDDSFFEGGATWMEDEVFDSANDNYNYLWPDFRDSLGDYNQSPYPFWLMLRGLTERFGSGVTGGGEQVMQDFWEATSQNTGDNLSALAIGLANKGVPLADAYHDFAIGAAFMRTCGGGYTLPFCFEEAAGYIANAGALPPVAGSISWVGDLFAGSIEDDYSLAWVTLPPSSTSYPITLSNTSTGGLLRATAVCDTGTSLLRSALPVVVGPGASTRLETFDTITRGCVRTLAVITNEQQSVGNPSASASRSFTLSTGGPRTSYVPLTPARLMDTRPGATTIDGVSADGGPIAPGDSRTLQVTGRGGVPAAGVSAVVLNITAVGSTTGGFLTVHPTGTARPLASNLNFGPGETIPNLVIAKVSAAGQVTIYNDTGSTNVIADVAGWFPIIP